MPAPMDSKARGTILAHHQNGHSHRKIVDALFELGFSVSKSTITRLIMEYEREKRGIFEPAKKLGPQCLPSKRNKNLIRKVNAATDVDNPPTLDQMAERYDVSEKTILRVLNEDLKSDLLKKTKTHAVSNKQAQERLDRGPRFLKLLGGGESMEVCSVF
ncbi:hypothetical protein BV898_06121 [Hypsibius exemplaris]|uniref:HTH psq-type domain-containing protein n=1 Tax=Hypsibius exemplaris TaxID=2072580 RepID=A0A1W0WXB6_HYPEX|nr:hypothetical protein BV898_06121 [Hypsibius exemplaris]